MSCRVVATLALCAALGLAGCAQQRPSVTINTPITAAELALYKRPGKASVVGEASLPQQGRGVLTCAGQQVLLTPAIAYNRRTIAAIRARQKPVAGPDVGSSQSLWRKTTCDARGRFRFRNVPAATWYVSIAVHWPDEPQEGALVREIRVPAAGIVRVRLTERDTVR